MEREIHKFLGYYGSQFANSVDLFLKADGLEIIRRIHSCVGKHRSTIYIFGNGGSYAISKCLEYALKEYALRGGLAIRVQTGLDVHDITSLALNNAPGVSFLRVLESEQANSEDLVVLISGSGNSDNLCQVAEYAKSKSIPAIAIIGSKKGRLKSLVAPENCFATPVEDQQISEDVIQSISYFIDRPLSDHVFSLWEHTVAECSREVKRAIKSIPEKFVFDLLNSVIRAFHEEKTIWVLGFEHPSLSVCAEHTAHNLYWDGVYQVDKPPWRIIRSTPTGCDFSGISNDRRKNVFRSLVGRENAQSGEIALLYLMDFKDSTVKEALNYFAALQIPVFALAANSTISGHENVFCYQTRLQKPSIQAGFTQIFGHILGRSIRMTLLQERGAFNGQVNRADFLINNDLAQRRLLDYEN